MNSNLLFRRTLASATRSPALSARLSRPTLLHPLLTRSVANTVSHKPASQTFEHAKTNIKEEAQHTASDIAKAIAGGNNQKDHFVSAIILLIDRRAEPYTG